MCFLTTVLALLALTSSCLARHHGPPLLTHLELCPNIPNTPDPQPIAVPSKPKNDIGITGDTLNITRCYCEKPDTWDVWGYVVMVHYWNYHNEDRYKVNYTCTSDKRSHPDIPKCWDTETRARHAPECDKHDKDNVFCFMMNFQQDFTLQWQPLVALDEFTYNKQIRLTDSLTPTSRPNPEVCNELCNDFPEIPLVPARDTNTTWEKTVKLTKAKDLTVKLCSRSEVYEDLDDMCDGCKRRKKVDS